jgi:hypothetical protein
MNGGPGKKDPQQFIFGNKNQSQPKTKFMRNVFSKVLCLLLFMAAITASAQDSLTQIEIDPRQYVVVKYRKSPTQGRLDTLWNWENRLSVPNQKIRYIDIDGEIRIDFLKPGLTGNKDFEGTFSLEADISGINGTRRIEVNPYSEIGVQRIPIGIKAEPPAEIAKKLLNMLMELKNADTIYRRVSRKSDEPDTLKKAFHYANEKLDNVLEYLSSFELAGEDASKAFLALINKDLIGYKFLKNKLTELKKRMEKIDIDQFSDLTSADAASLTKNKGLIIETNKYLVELSRFEGSPLEKIIKQFAETEYVPTDEKLQQYIGTIKYKENFYTIIDKHRDQLAGILSTEAGKLIYKKLIYATIDLGKSGASSGEVLNVYITWILDPKKDSLGNSPRLPIGKYYLNETGWRMDVADMFAMIKRVDERKADPATLSPSNFKGSGGAVLMWTFNKEDRGLRISPGSNGKYNTSRKNRFVNFLEPSIGLNVSYLDFSTDKDVEIGTGLQLGIFRNKIFFGYGVNLHMLSPKNQSPGYFYIGFSFARLSDLFKNTNNVPVSR